MNQEDEDFLYQMLTDIEGLDGENMDKFLEHCRKNPIPGCAPDNTEPQSSDEQQN
ncbi:MAG: hypothetical protein VZR56_05030 [Treponema sp.]|nr:hypothetical protein [Treponema sp.]MEE3313505.1 hypothetical protein [Treponema sp.]